MSVVTSEANEWPDVSTLNTLAQRSALATLTRLESGKPGLRPPELSVLLPIHSQQRTCDDFQ